MEHETIGCICYWIMQGLRNAFVNAAYRSGSSS